MLPLADEHVLDHDIRRVAAAETVDEIVVATSTETADDIVARYAERAGATVFRGSETNVLGRMFDAAAKADAETVVRITADCPLVSPDVIDAVVERLHETGADYCSNIGERTFPRGLDVEAFTFESIQNVADEATDPAQREHVILTYREDGSSYVCRDVTADQVFEEPWMQDRTDLRLTLDEADDCKLLRAVYDGIDTDGLLDVRGAVRYVTAVRGSGTATKRGLQQSRRRY